MKAIKLTLSEKILSGLTLNSLKYFKSKNRH